MLLLEIFRWMAVAAVAGLLLWFGRNRLSLLNRRLWALPTADAYVRWRLFGFGNGRGWVIAGLLLAAGLVGDTILGYRPALVFGILGMGCAFREVWYLQAQRRRQLLEQIRREGYRICPHCMYSLQGLPDVGCCPECGAAYDVAKLATTWHEVLGPS